MRRALSQSRRVLITLVACAALGAPVSAAEAQSRTQGSPLASPANYAYGCETRWLPGTTPPFDMEPINVGPSTCTIYQSGTVLSESHLTPGIGLVTKARIKSGANPAPVSIAIIRRFFRPSQEQPGTMQYTCCLGVHETPVVQPAPNAVTEIPVNKAALTAQPTDKLTGYWDIIAVNVHGPGSLPMADRGPHPGIASPSMPVAFWQFPKTSPGDNNISDWNASNFEVLMQYDFCPGAAGRVARAAQACATQDPGPGGGGPANPPVTGTPLTPTPPTGQPEAKAPVQLAGKALTLAGRRVKLSVSCALQTACKGTVRLLTRGRKPVLLAGRKLSIGAGQTKAVALTVLGKHRKKVTRRGIKVRAEVDLGAAGKVTRDLKLKRKQR